MKSTFPQLIFARTLIVWKILQFYNVNLELSLICNVGNLFYLGSS